MYCSTEGFSVMAALRINVYRNVNADRHIRIVNKGQLYNISLASYSIAHVGILFNEQAPVAVDRRLKIFSLSGG